MSHARVSLGQAFCRRAYRAIAVLKLLWSSIRTITSRCSNKELTSSSHKGVLINGGLGCPFSTHLGTKRHSFVTPGYKTMAALLVFKSRPKELICCVSPVLGCNKNRPYVCSHLRCCLFCRAVSVFASALHWPV